MSDFSQIAKLPTLNKKQNHKVVHQEKREILHNYQTLVVSAIIAPTTKKKTSVAQARLRTNNS